MSEDIYTAEEARARIRARAALATAGQNVRERAARRRIEHLQGPQPATPEPRLRPTPKERRMRGEAPPEVARPIVLVIAYWLLVAGIIELVR